MIQLYIYIYTVYTSFIWDIMGVFFLELMFGRSQDVPSSRALQIHAHIAAYDHVGNPINLSNWGMGIVCTKWW